MRIAATAALALAALTAGLVSTPAYTASERGTIKAYKFNDRNGNGELDEGEEFLEGFRIIVTSLGPIDLQHSRETDGNGRAVFRNLPVQRYSVCEVALPPWIPTTPECVTVRLKGKAPVEEVLFGNRRQPDNPPPGDVGCVRTQGFWGSSPAGQALVPVLVPGTLSLGNTAYTAAQLDDILDEPTRGNALLILAHQLIAAKLNVLAGAEDECIAVRIAAADSTIGDLVIPPVGNADVDPSSPLGQDMTSLAEELDDYNNGRLCSPHCPSRVFR